MIIGVIDSVGDDANAITEKEKQLNEIRRFKNNPFNTQSIEGRKLYRTYFYTGKINSTDFKQRRCVG